MALDIRRRLTWIIVILLLLITSFSYAKWRFNPHTRKLDYYMRADDLSADSTPSSDDYIITLDDPDGTPTPKYTTISNLSKGQVGINETFGSGWNGDTGIPEKDDIYDYLHQFDADDDGSLSDESWYVGVNEAYGSGWSSDTGIPEKDDIYDYLHQIDTDDDGSLDDETITPTMNSIKLTEHTSSPTEVVKQLYMADVDTYDPLGRGGTDNYWYGYDGSNHWGLVTQSGTLLASAVVLPTLELDDLNDTSTPHALVANEHRHKIISNGNVSAAATLTLLEHTSSTEGWNFYVKDEATTAGYDLTVDVHANDNAYFKYKGQESWIQLGAGNDVECVVDGIGLLHIYSTERGLYMVSDGGWTPASAISNVYMPRNGPITESIALSGDDSSLTNYDLDGRYILITDNANDDLKLPDCNTDVPDGTWHIWVCQAAASETVSIGLQNTSDNFKTRDGTGLDDDDELDSPGAALKRMCAHLLCFGSASTNGVWEVIEETGGDSGLDSTWVDGGAAD